MNKRLRFEVLRRDGFRCTYCGATPKEKELHVDHLIPVALGGTDAPENLATACADCNQGKASTTLEAETVAELDRARAVESAARASALQRLATDFADLDAYEDMVQEVWESVIPSYRLRHCPRVPDKILRQWFDDDVPTDLIRRAVRVAADADHVSWQLKAIYANGVLRHMIEEAMRAG